MSQARIPEGWACTRCSRTPALHDVFWPATGKEESLCCQCAAHDETSDPADWHPGCVAAHRRAERERRGNDPVPEQPGESPRFRGAQWKAEVNRHRRAW